jgi:hypothetical protein
MTRPNIFSGLSQVNASKLHCDFGCGTGYIDIAANLSRVDRKIRRTASGMLTTVSEPQVIHASR